MYGEYNNNCGRKSLIYWLLEYIKCLLPAFLYELIFSYSTSPIYEYTVHINDSYIFQIIGKYWNTGCIPYVDLFDHKGPLIFFINAAGYAITGNRYGIFMIQIGCMSVVIMLAVAMLRTAFSQKQAIILAAVSLIGASATFEEGNLTEEYILPFLMISFFVFWKWANHFMKDGSIIHKPAAAFIYGLTFGVAVMTRINNAIGICFISIFVMVILVKNQKWRNLFSNICSFIFGGGVWSSYRSLFILPYTVPCTKCGLEQSDLMFHI